MQDKGLNDAIEKPQLSSYKIDGEVLSRTVHIYNWRKKHGSVFNSTSEAGAKYAIILLVRHLVAD